MVRMSAGDSHEHDPATARRRSWLALLVALIAVTGSVLAVVWLFRAAADDGEEAADPSAVRRSVWTGQELIGLGDSSAVRWAPGDDGWAPLPEPPFADLEAVDGVWTGSEVVVVGFTCDVRQAESATVFCDPGAAVAMRLDPDGRWHSVPSSDEAPFAGTSDGRAVWLRAAGWDGDELVGILNGRPFALEPHRGRWRALPEFPADAFGEYLCASARGIASLNVYERGDGERGPSRVSVLSSDGWSPSIPAPVGPSLYAEGICAAGSPVVVTSTVDTGGARLDVGKAAIFDVDSRQWREFPAPPEPIENAALVASDESGRVLVHSPEGLHVLDTRTGVWTELAERRADDEGVVAWTPGSVIIMKGSEPALRPLPSDPASQ